MNKFINRKLELDLLEKKWAEKKAQFFVIYGKRRVGKTEIIKQFMKNKAGVYFLADKRTEIEQLKEAGRLLGERYSDPIIRNRGFQDWLEVFEYLKRHNKERFIFAVDEYPYLVEVNKAISSIFQKGWDEYLKNTNIFFILSGSSIAMMESETLIYSSPLYGRRTGSFLIEPLFFKEMRKFFPGYDFKKALEIFAISGGMPAYISQFDKNLSLEENIEAKIFSKIEFLHNEAEFVIKEELREVKNYLSILKAISFGMRKFSEIINETGMEKNVLTKYLQTLERLKIIEKEVPATQKNASKFRKGLYQISDNYFRFWFQYVFPYKSDLEIGKYGEVKRKLKESFNIFVSFTYEKVCLEILRDMEDKIFTFERIGKWWDKNEEIDVIGLNGETGEIIFGEAKWSEKKVGVNIFHDLKRKAELVEWEKGERKEYFILFSKSGFTADMEKLAKKENVFLVKRDKLLLPQINKSPRKSTNIFGPC